MLQTKFMFIKSDQPKPKSPTRRVTYVVGHDSSSVYIYIFVQCNVQEYFYRASTEEPIPDKAAENLTFLS